MPYDARVGPVDFFTRRFAAAGDAAGAVAAKAYMKSALDFHGVSAAIVRAASREFAVTLATRAELRRAVDALYATRNFDLHSAAVGILERHLALLTTKDAAWLIGLVRQSACWAHVDWLATKIVPATLPADPAPLLRKWAGDDDFWVRRTALLAQLDVMRAGAGDFALFAELAAPMLEEKEFFIRKAIGWVLRDVSKKRPELIAKFVRKHHARMSGLTFREAIKRLPDAMKEPLQKLR
jgi:3-methyladenine DNA glycosylase AlkD